MSKPKSGARNSNFRRNNPKRGAPGILVITETGRENKGRREGLEILQHYFYSSSGTDISSNVDGGGEKTSSSLSSDANAVEATHDNLASGESSSNKVSLSSSSTNKTLTLEEEIALLKKGVSADAVLRGANANVNSGTNKHGKVKVNSGPFRVYETGCRGTVFIMSTTPNCELISVPAIAWKNKDDKPANEEEGSTVTNGNDEAKSDSNRCDTEEYANSDDISGSTRGNEDSELHAKRKRENDKIETDQISAAADGKKQKTESSGQGDEESTRTKSSTEDNSNKWDPIQTVNSILDDIRTQNIEAPRSRFVTRMVPIQVTCFASMEEIEAHARILIAKYLMPIGIEHHAHTQKKKGADVDVVTKMPSFKIEFKRRNCSHIRRDNVVQSIANIVESLTANHWKMQCLISTHPTIEEAETETVTDTSSADAHTSSNQKKNNSPVTTKVEPLFSVNLTNPDYSIVVELCRTLCGLSVVPDPKSFQNFNLMRVQEEIQDKRD